MIKYQKVLMQFVMPLKTPEHDKPAFKSFINVKNSQWYITVSPKS